MSEKTFGPLDIITGQDKLWEPLNKGHVVIDNSNKVSDPFAPVSFDSRPPSYIENGPISEEIPGALNIITGQNESWEPPNEGHVVIDNSLSNNPDPFAPVSFGSRPPARSGGVSSKRNFPPRSVSPS